MISLIEKNKRLIFFLFFVLLFFFSGAGMIEHHIHLTGGLFLFSAFFILCYLPVFWLLNRFNYIQNDAVRWKKEIWGMLILGGLLSFIGAMECSFGPVEFTAPFILLWVLVGLLSVLYLRREQIRRTGTSRIDKRSVLQFAFWFFLFG